MTDPSLAGRGTHAGGSDGPNESESHASLLPYYAFLPTQVPLGANSTLDNVHGEDAIRQYGFLHGIGRNVVLSVDDVARVIRDVGSELGRRALDTPLLFSNQSLELNQTRIKMLIKSFVATLKASGRSPAKRAAEAFTQDVQFANDHELAWLLRWALSRLTRVREGTREAYHGCLDWDMYEEWRGRERGESRKGLFSHQPQSTRSTRSRRSRRSSRLTSSSMLSAPCSTCSRASQRTHTSRVSPRMRFLPSSPLCSLMCPPMCPA